MLFSNEDTRPRLHFRNVQNAVQIQLKKNYGIVTLIFVLASASRGFSSPPFVAEMV